MVFSRLGRILLLVSPGTYEEAYQVEGVRVEPDWTRAIEMSVVFLGTRLNTDRYPRTAMEEC